MSDFARVFRNCLVLTILYSGTVLGIAYLSCVIFGITIGQFFFPYNLSNVYSTFYYVYYYYVWIFQNIDYFISSGTAGLTVYDYLVPKLVLSTLGLYIIAAIIIYKNREPLLTWRPYKKKEKLHGDAKWADEEDVQRAGLRSKDGLLIGKDKNGYYIAPGYQHALLFAPTGSGKGVGFVIPNLLFWSESVIVHDIKLENHELTSGWRAKQGQKVFVWAPAEPDGVTHCYNPIDWVSSKPGQMVDDVQKIANLILPQKEFWNNEARTLFVGVILYLLAVPDKIKTFGQVVRELRSDDVIYNFAVVLDTIGKYIHPVGYMNLAAFLQKAEKERSGVISTLNSGLELWANPLIDAATAKSDFNIQLFKKEKTTVYVGLTPDNIKRLEPLMKVFYQQATEFLSRKIPKKEEDPYGVLFLMDEFPTLGKMEQFLTGIAYFRGYNVRLFLIIQDTQQLKGIYEDAGMNSFLSNSTYRITYSANNVETAKLISELCGNKTVEQVSNTKPKFLDFNPASRTQNVSETQRALLLPQEVINLPRDDQIVLIESFPPIRSKKIKYFEDKFFTKRLLPPTPIPTQEPFDPSKFMVGKRVVNNDDSEGDDTDLLEDVDDSNDDDSVIKNSNLNARYDIENGFSNKEEDEDDDYDFDEADDELDDEEYDYSEAELEDENEEHHDDSNNQQEQENDEDEIQVDENELNEFKLDEEELEDLEEDDEEETNSDSEENENEDKRPNQPDEDAKKEENKNKPSEEK